MSSIVIPSEGELASTAALLLSLADHVHDVRTASNGTQFEVPDYLAERYHAHHVPPRTRRRRSQNTEMEG
jgi:hypothetical protein